MARQVFLNSKEDMHWLQEVHNLPKYFRGDLD